MEEIKHNQIFIDEYCPSAKNWINSLNKTITILEIKDDGLYIYFDDRSGIFLRTESDCCAHHYFVCDDDLPSFIGGVLLGGEIREAPNVKEENGDSVHEVQFLEIKTSKGSFVISCHNEHNGYYGGFYLYVSKALSIEDLKQEVMKFVGDNSFTCRAIFRNFSKEYYLKYNEFEKFILNMVASGELINNGINRNDENLFVKRS